MFLGESQERDTPLLLPANYGSGFHVFLRVSFRFLYDTPISSLVAFHSRKECVVIHTIPPAQSQRSWHFALASSHRHPEHSLQRHPDIASPLRYRGDHQSQDARYCCPAFVL